MAQASICNWICCCRLYQRFAPRSSALGAHGCIPKRVIKLRDDGIMQRRGGEEPLRSGTAHLKSLHGSSPTPPLGHISRPKI